jgi:hypothetical protein
MTQQTAENNLHKWFWVFKHKMVDDFPEYHSTFDLIAGNADSNGVLYEVLEFAYRHLKVEAELRGGMDNLSIIDYSTAMDYAYEEWVN